jgi:adenosylhomocysteine nucleosidase
MPVAAVTGLAAEARIACRVGLRGVAGGGDPDRAVAVIKRFIGDGATGLISFGICGGLDPTLASGALIVPRAVRTENQERHPVAGRWHRALVDALGVAGISPATGDLLGATSIVDTPARKAALFAATGAIGVDLESHLVALAAGKAGLPFVAVRVVADPAGCRLPPAVLVGLDHEGRPALGAVLASLARQPSQIASLIRVGIDTRRALAALRRTAHVVGAQLRSVPN